MILCYGGSFNPIHHGHLICARAVAEAKGYERILLIPSAQPPHKPKSQDIANPADRLEMCRRATADSPLFEVSDIEIQRQGPSYTIDTVRQLKSEGWDEVHWLIGADMLMYLPQWHEAMALLDEVHWVITARPGWSLDWDALPTPFQRLRHNVVETPRIDISASDIRRRVAAGLGIEYLTPHSVCQYIRDRKLYR